MFLDIGRIYQDIIQIDKDESVQIISQEIIHHSHELCGGIGKPKWHYHVFKESPPHLKCYLVIVSGSDWYLPISRREVDLVEHLGITQPIEHVL